MRWASTLLRDGDKACSPRFQSEGGRQQHTDAGGSAVSAGLVGGTLVSQSRHRSFKAQLPARAAALTETPDCGSWETVAVITGICTSPVMFGSLTAPALILKCEWVGFLYSGGERWVKKWQMCNHYPSPIWLFVTVQTNRKRALSLPPDDDIHIIGHWIFTAHLPCYGWGFSQFWLRRHLATFQTRVREFNDSPRMYIGCGHCWA